MKEGKRISLNYGLTEKRLIDTIRQMVESDKELSVKRVADEAVISLSTAYKHNCQEKILEEIHRK